MALGVEIACPAVERKDRCRVASEDADLGLERDVAVENNVISTQSLAAHPCPLKVRRCSPSRDTRWPPSNFIGCQQLEPYLRCRWSFPATPSALTSVDKSGEGQSRTKDFVRTVDRSNCTGILRVNIPLLSASP
jgi:hypothetical protein